MTTAATFSKEILDLRNEILAIKTAHYKTASSLATKSQSVAFSIPLTIEEATGEVIGTRQAVVTAITTDGFNMLSALSLGTTTMNGRTISVIRRLANTGVSRFVVAVAAGNDNDFTTIANGGAVTVTLTITVTGTSDFTLTTAYESYPPS